MKTLLTSAMVLGIVATFGAIQPTHAATGSSQIQPTPVSFYAHRGYYYGPGYYYYSDPYYYYNAPGLCIGPLCIF